MEQRLNAEEFCIDKDFVFIVGTVVSFGFLGFEGLHSGGSFDCSPFVVEFRTLDMCFFCSSPILLLHRTPSTLRCPVLDIMSCSSIPFWNNRVALVTLAFLASSTNLLNQ